MEELSLSDHVKYDGVGEIRGLAGPFLAHRRLVKAHMANINAYLTS